MKCDVDDNIMSMEDVVGRPFFLFFSIILVGCFKHM